MFYNPEKYKIMVITNCNPSQIEIVMNALSDEYLWKSGNSIKDKRYPDVQYLYINVGIKRLSYNPNKPNHLVADDVYAIDEFVRRKIWRYL